MYRRKADDLKLKGTTTLALKCADGLIMATDTRATMLPGFVAHKKVKKVYQVTDKIGMTIAGVPAEALNLLDILKANASIYQLQRKRAVPVKTIASLASTVLFSQRYYPYAVQIVIGGHDSEGYHLYSLDPFGSAIEDDMIATGSGSPVAYGVLESEYNNGIKLKNGLNLAAKAIRSAIKRDVYTGDSFDIATITKEEGYAELDEKTKRKLLGKEAS
ncbi:MAG: archaeal proteasome endopeptidase complex subunit beta [Candidatus Bathyarchaeota archaeon]|nr:archaeal proteasome endopeptidase complex subunit beta [Candidatus Bathyarchaeota archaeon]